MLRQKPTQVLPWKLLKEATIHYYCLFDESRLSDILTIIKLKEANWLCKHMKNVRSDQPCISMNFCAEFSTKSSMWISLIWTFSETSVFWLNNNLLLLVMLQLQNYILEAAGHRFCIFLPECHRIETPYAPAMIALS